MIHCVLSQCSNGAICNAIVTVSCVTRLMTPGPAKKCESKERRYVIVSFFFLLILFILKYDNRQVTRSCITLYHTFYAGSYFSHIPNRHVMIHLIQLNSWYWVFNYIFSWFFFFLKKKRKLYNQIKCNIYFLSILHLTKIFFFWINYFLKNKESKMNRPYNKRVNIYEACIQPKHKTTTCICFLFL